MAEPKTVKIGEDPEDRRVEEDGATYSEPDLGADMPATAVERRSAARVAPRQARAAMNAWIAGATFEWIADRFDYASPSVARVVIEEAISKAYKPEEAKAMFAKTHARYEDLIRGIWPKAQPKIPELDPDTGDVVKDKNGRTVMVNNPEHIAYVKLAADIVGRQAKLHGVEAPVQVQITPSSEQFSTFVAQVVAQARENEAEEADIFAEDEVEDAEVVED